MMDRRGQNSVGNRPATGDGVRRRGVVSTGRLLAVAFGVGVIWLAGGPTPGVANPDHLTVQSALTWRDDGAGDLLLPAPRSGTYECPTSVQTADQISTMTASWTALGSVTLALSADDGRTYTPVVNGVPVASGFQSGTRLRWRATVGVGARLIEVRVTYTDRAGTTASFGTPALSGFSFRKPIMLTIPSGGALAGSPPVGSPLVGYQLRLQIGESAAAPGADVHLEGHGRRDFADLRFTTADGETLVPHYLERVSGAGPTQVATVWVKVPEIPPAGVTLYLYYGNPSATDRSDGHAVFEFFESFAAATDTALDPAIWPEGRGGASPSPSRWEIRSEADGRATLVDGGLSLTAASIRTKAWVFSDGIVEFLAQTATGQDDVRLLLREDPAAAPGQETGQVAYASAYAGAEHCLSVGNIVKANAAVPAAPATFYGYRVTAQGAQVAFERYDETWTRQHAEVRYEDVGGLTQGALGLRSDGTATYQWIRVRQPGAPPVVTRPGRQVEETVALPVFDKTELAPNGDLVLAPKAALGAYRAAPRPTPFMTAILTPTWQGVGARVEISADGGRTSQLKAQSGTTYYASKGAFTAGREVVATVTLEQGSLADAPAFTALILSYDPGMIVVIAPNGGESWRAGTTYAILWSALAYEATYPMRLAYSLDAGKTYTTIASSVINSGRYAWTIPEHLAASEALIRVSDANNPAVADTSARPFAVRAAPAPAASPEASAPPPEGAAPPPEGAALPPEGATPAPAVLATGDAGAWLTQWQSATDLETYEVAVTVREAAHRGSRDDPRQYHAGDIVLVRPAGIPWSEAEQENYLILKARLPPEAVADLMSSLERQTGETDANGHAVMRMMSRRRFHLDLAPFDLTPNPSDAGRSPTRRHFLAPGRLETLLRQRGSDASATPAS